MKFFNTAGPVNRDNHYKIDPLKRWNMDEILNGEKLITMFVQFWRENSEIFTETSEFNGCQIEIWGM